MWPGSTITVRLAALAGGRSWRTSVSERLQEDSSISAAFSAEVKLVLDTLDDLSADELGTKIKEYGNNSS